MTKRPCSDAKHTLTVFSRLSCGRDALQVEENPSLAKKGQNLGVESPFSLLRLMMYGKS